MFSLSESVSNTSCVSQTSRLEVFSSRRDADNDALDVSQGAPPTRCVCGATNHSHQCGRIERAMLAPIITKDMKLFPSRPLPSNIKNVRSRAQSLDQVSTLQSTSNITGRVIPVRPRNSQSTGNLPAVARSPPSSGTRKTTLSAIQEGVELSVPKDPEPSTSNNNNTIDLPLKNGLSVLVKKMTPSQAAKIDAVKKSKLSTGSSSDSTSEDGERKDIRNVKKKRSVVKWITSMFRKNSDGEDDIAKENVSTVSS